MRNRGSSRPRRAGALALVLSGLVALAVLLGGGSARAHLLAGSPTLHQLTLASDVVAVARVTHADAVLALEDPPLRRAVIDVEIGEVLRGDVRPGPLRFVPHGHGAQSYADGEEVLLFLQKIERSRELAGTRVAGPIRWFAVHETGDRLTLDAGSREALIAAARAYVAIDSMNDPIALMEALRRVTAKLLASNEPRLASFALKDVVTAGETPLITAADAPALLAVADDRARPAAFRAGLLAELERRKLADTAPRWAEALRETKLDELLPFLRASRGRTDARITVELARMLGGSDAMIASEAAIALGSRGNAAAVDPLSGALARDDARIRGAAIRALGQVGTPEARRALSRAAAQHPSEETRRLASAEMSLLPPPSEGADAPSSPAPPAAPVEGRRDLRWAAWALFALAVIVIGKRVIAKRRAARSGVTSASDAGPASRSRQGR